MSQDRRTPYRDTLLGIGTQWADEQKNQNQKASPKSNLAGSLLAAALLGSLGGFSQRPLGSNDLMEALYGSGKPNHEPAEPNFYDPFEKSRPRPAGPQDTPNGFAETLRALLGEVPEPPPLEDGMHQVSVMEERIAVVRHHCASNTFRAYTVKINPANKAEFLPGICLGSYPTQEAAEARVQAYADSYAQIMAESAALQNLTNLFAAPQA